MASSPLSKQYRWAEGYRGGNKAQAQALGTILQQLKKGGTVSARAVVAAARPKRSPIHAMFEWDDGIAGEKWREQEARHHMRHLEVIVKPNGAPIVLPVTVSFGAGQDYRHTEDVMSNAELREQLIQQALSEARSWRQRYNYLKELSDIFEAIDAAEHAVA